MACVNATGEKGAKRGKKEKKWKTVRSGERAP